MKKCGSLAGLLFLLFSIVLLVSRSHTAATSSTAATVGEDDGGVGDVSGKLYMVEGRLHGDEAQATVTLHGNGGRLSVVPSTSGKFELSDIPAGAYLLEITSNKYAYPLIRVDVSARQNGKVKARWEETNKHIHYPLDLHPLAPIAFFEERKRFEIMSLLKNPMVIMVALPVVVMLLAKGLTGSEAMQQQIAELTGNQPNPNDLVNTWLARDEKKKKKNN